ncbi:hypothetical protein BWQ96_07220 [Gracilariopsis chorda]|uniref:Uncharacterized protein n=1 Tax=Gracilariopsis chorda TaxID=448386 RepID=A0A2V3ILZ2_9FLOR|nr:hypothetical protein BWQ96_07220 [Gracilariopsis chorda]|eukprot:PXF43073.1 hypothetical protein BWQ96_07220 [Gracilariopsis chorda]
MEIMFATALIMRVGLPSQSERLGLKRRKQSASRRSELVVPTATDLPALESGVVHVQEHPDAWDLLRS